MLKKSPSDVRGVRVSCPSYEKCPLCYGCRAFDPNYEECIKCEEDGKKKNICNTERHKGDLLAKMIIRDKVTIK